MIFRDKGEITVNINGATYKTCNTKTNLHRQYYANWLTYDYPINYYTGSPSVGRYAIAIGDGTAEPSYGDTKLGNELFRKAVAVRYVARTYNAKMITTYTTTEPWQPPSGTAINIKEYGLFDEAPITITNDRFQTWSGSPASPDGWLKTGGTWSDNSGTAYIFDRTHSCKFVGSAQIYQSIALDNSWKGKDLTFRLAVYDTAGKTNPTQVFINDGLTYTYSNSHSATAQFEIMSVTKTISASATALQVGAWIREGTAYLNFANLTPDGKLLARGLLDINKAVTQPMSLTWEIYLEEVEEDNEMGYKAYTFETVNVGTVSAGSLGSALYSPSGTASAERAIISVESYNIRYRYDGGTPTSSVGHVGGSANNITITDLTNIQQFRAISTGAGSAVLRVTYEH